MKRSLIILICVLLIALSAACGSAKAEEREPVDVNALYEELVSSEGMPQMTKLSAARQFDYCGIDPEWVKESAVALCADSIRADEIWLVEANDSESAELISQAAEGRLSHKEAELKDYNAEQYKVVKDAVMLRNGNFIALLVSPDADSLSKLVTDKTGAR